MSGEGMSIGRTAWMKQTSVQEPPHQHSLGGEAKLIEDLESRVRGQLTSKDPSPAINTRGGMGVIVVHSQRAEA